MRIKPAAILISLFYLAGFFALCLPAAAADPYDAIERSLGLVESGDMGAARVALSGATDDGASHPLLLSARAVAELNAGDYMTAETTFRAVLATDPQQLSALWGLALCLLQRNRAFEATMIVDRAAAVAPTDTRVKTLQAYVYLLLGRIGDAANAGKAALDGGGRSPFLFAVLAQIHRRMGYAQKALDFGACAAKSFAGMDYLTPDKHLMLPLTMLISDTPQALSNLTVTAAKPTDAKRTDMEIELPPQASNADSPAFQITTPRPGSALRGMQRVQANYRGEREIKFVIFMVDHVMRGMTTELPYHFMWDADASSAGAHQLTVRAYDYRGVVTEEASITVTTLSGQPVSAPETTARAKELQQHMMTVTMPTPQPCSLFTLLGGWYRDSGDTPRAIEAFEKAAALDPTAEGVLENLQQLYRANGLHSVSLTGEVTHGPASAGGSKRVALTFDDGPTPMYTPSVLAELKRYNIHATFFMVGKRVQQFPELVLDIMADGHELANHSYTHPNLTRLSSQEILAEVLRNRAVVKEITGRTTYLFRPPGGDIDDQVTKELRALDYNIIYWDVSAGVYSKLPPWEQASRVLDHIHDGSIVLLHNGPIDGTLSILPVLLSTLTREGYTFVTVSEMMKGK